MKRADAGYYVFLAALALASFIVGFITGLFV